MDVMIYDVQRQRNGVSGVPFTHVVFRFREQGAQHQLQAILLDPDDEKRLGGVACFVIDTRQPVRHWRGDHFADVLIPAIEAWRAEKGKA